MWNSIRKSKTGMLGLFIVAFVIFLALTADFIAPFDPNEQNIEKKFLPPAFAENLLGTDQLGRDELSRLIHGSRISLLVGLAGTAIAGLIGVLVGAISGYYGGRTDSFLMRIVDVQLAFPFILLAIFIVATLGPSLLNIIIVAAISGWVHFARLVRGEILAVKSNEYIEAIRSVGAKNRVIIFKHILPNIMNPVIVFATLEMAKIILMEASLSFLGLGVPSEIPTWGKMLAESRVHMLTTPTLAILPGVAITLIVLGVNLLGDWLRDYLDPKLKQIAK